MWWYLKRDNPTSPPPPSEKKKKKNAEQFSSLQDARRKEREERSNFSHIHLQTHQGQSHSGLVYLQLTVTWWKMLCYFSPPVSSGVLQCVCVHAWSQAQGGNSRMPAYASVLVSEKHTGNKQVDPRVKGCLQRGCGVDKGTETNSAMQQNVAESSCFVIILVLIYLNPCALFNQ